MRRRHAVAVLLLVAALPGARLRAQGNPPRRLRLEAIAGLGDGVPGNHDGSATGLLGGVQLGRAGGGRWSPTLLAGGGYAPSLGAGPHSLSYDRVALFALLGVAREMGRARRLSLTGEYGVSTVDEILNTVPERDATRGYGERGFETRAVGAVGAAYRVPVGRFMGLVHARVFFSGLYGLPLPSEPQAALTLGIGRR